MKLDDITIKQKLEYSKSEWLKPYIEFNIQKRKEAKAKGDKFGDVFFMLMNNAIYGKQKSMYIIDVKDVELLNDVGKLKGITKATIKNQINLEDYQNFICEGKTKYVTNYTIDSKRHNLETKE